MQHKAVYYSASSLYMFRVSTTPIIRSTQTVTTVSGTAATSFNVTELAWPCWRKVAAPLPEAVVTVLSTPDDGCG